MLETLRSWQETNYQPNRSFLFIAYAGEGYESSQGPHAPLRPDRFLKAKQGFSQFDIEAIVLSRGLGMGEAQVMEMGTDGANRSGVIDGAHGFGARGAILASTRILSDNWVRSRTLIVGTGY